MLTTTRKSWDAQWFATSLSQELTALCLHHPSLPMVPLESSLFSRQMQIMTSSFIPSTWDAIVYSLSKVRLFQNSRFLSYTTLPLATPLFIQAVQTTTFTGTVSLKTSICPFQHSRLMSSTRPWFSNKCQAVRSSALPARLCPPHPRQRMCYSSIRRPVQPLSASVMLLQSGRLISLCLRAQVYFQFLARACVPFNNKSRFPLLMEPPQTLPHLMTVWSLSTPILLLVLHRLQRTALKTKFYS